MTIELCEICSKNPGQLNSRYQKDDNGEGLWVCWDCEWEEGGDYTCPCGCEDDPSKCVYATNRKAGS
jgi:hypothetical protein